MNFIKLICAASICLILNGCNPAFVTGMAKGFTEQLERRSIQKNSERQVYGMTKDKARAEELANELSSSIVINGDGLDEEILKEANLEGTETVLALTNDDENNMMVCVLAEKSGQKKRTIAIVNKSNYNLLQDSLNIDDLVDPRMTTVSRIMEHVHKGTIGTVYSLLDGQYEFIEAKILEKSELLNKKIRDCYLPEDIRIGAIVRKEKVIIPRSNFIFEKDDLVVFLAKREQLKAVENIFSVGTI